MLAVAIVVRLHEATTTRLWFDEIYPLWTVRHGPRAMLAMLRGDVHPPLHFLLTWAWWALGGEGTLWMRSLAILFGVANVAVLWTFAREAYGRGAAWLAAALLALHPVHVYYSQEAGACSLLWLLLTLAAWMAWRWVERGRRADAAAYVASATLALSTHYSAALMLGFLALWSLLALLRSGRRARVPSWLALHGAITLLLAPQAIVALGQLRRFRHEHWVRAATGDDLATWSRHLAFGSHLLVLPLILLSAVPILRREQRVPTRLLWFVSFLPVEIAWAFGTRVWHVFLERYMDYVVPAWCALLGAGAMGFRWRTVRVGLAGALLAIAARSLVLHRPLEEPVSLGNVLDYVRSHADTGEAIFHADTHSLLFFRQHAPEFRKQYIVAEAGLPYYEVGYLIPAEWRLTPDRWRAMADTSRWWGVYARHGGIDVHPIATMLDSAATGVEVRSGIATVWQGRPEIRLTVP